MKMQPVPAVATVGKTPPGRASQRQGSDGCRGLLPAAGNRNDTNLNNVGSNGNYWSSSLNSDNSNNAWNVNFNSSNVNRNNNNRYNGQSVRPVSESFADSGSLPFSTSAQQLLIDLYHAYLEARRHKRKKNYQLSFERNLESNLIRLRDVIINRRYRPGPSTCFIIHDPKMREIFAASFRDRVVHHLLYGYISPFLECQFIDDSYSCIKGRGTHYGINRLEQHIMEVSGYYSRPCHVLKLDIRGYFMHIDRSVLLDICKRRLIPFRDKMDWPLVEYLLDIIVLYNPVENCNRRGSLSDWDDLPPSKSLFCSPAGCGLPIGNLTSQLFSNVYLNELDQYMTASLGLRHYGRYVDDAYVVSSSKTELRIAAKYADRFLREMLHLELNPTKTQIHSAYRGVEFLGAYLKPFRKYVGSDCVKRMERKFPTIFWLPAKSRWNAINSYLGITSHFSAYKIRRRWTSGPLHEAFRDGYFLSGLLKYRMCHS